MQAAEYGFGGVTDIFTVHALEKNCYGSQKSNMQLGLGKGIK